MVGTLGATVAIGTGVGPQLASAGALSALLTPKLATDSALGGNGALTSAAVAGYQRAGTLAGVGALATPFAQRYAVASALSGAGALTTPAYARIALPASLSGGGALSANVIQTGSVGAGLSGSGTLSVTTTAREPVTIVGVSAIGTTSATVPAHQIGDLILVCAARMNANAVPGKPAAGGTVPNFTDIDAATGTNSSSIRTAQCVATATNHTSGVWANATAICVIVLRGQHSSPIGGHAESGTASSATSVAPAITVADTSGFSKIIHFHSSVAGNSSFNGTPSAGYTRISATANLMVVNSKNNTTTDGTANQTMAGGATFNRCAAVEVMAA